MSEFDDTELNREEARKVAVAEYVLGQGTPKARAAMALAIETDSSVAAEARFWQTRLAWFNEDYDPVSPPAHLLSGIEKRLFGETASASPAWYDALAFWRGLTGVAAIAAVLAIGLYVFEPTPQQPLDTTQMVAALQPVEGDMTFMARYDAQSGALMISGTGDAAGEGSDYELWFIEGENDPISMGVVGMGEVQRVAVADPLREQFSQGITLAVTREIAGGSPTGDPQGPIVAAGPVTAI